MATMNPGGDVGKKELSPALRNRFTEIWVPRIEEEEDLRSIIDARVSSASLNILTEPLLKFWKVSQLNKIDFANEAMSRGKMLQIIEGKIGMHPFFVPRGPVNLKGFTFELMAPTTSTNIFRILRAMQLQKPVLIEGSPGVGKTSLIMALANISGHPLVRINLSEQTDMIDLLGSDLPHEGAEGAEFKWSDGVFLQALKMGSWVLLDELNLASQSVLEGLNACLDHRGEVFIPELGRSFKCHPTFRIFACQNPPLQGGGRKRLPRSFLNRFTKVYVDMLSDEDFLFIARSLYPSIPVAFLQKLIQFNGRLLKDTMIDHSYGHLGAPWEFNLRDVLRSCAILQESNADNMSFLDVIYLQRMRTARDRHCVLKLYKEVFGNTAQLEAYPNILIDPKYLKVGTVSVPRFDGPQSPNEKEGLAFLPSQSKALESLLLCVKHGWMCILVGPTGCGKTSIVRTLSKLMGASLQEFMMSSGTDTADLLGCFEQYDALRCLNQLVSRVRYLIRAVFGGVVIAADTTFPACKLISFLRKLLGDWSTFEKFFNMRFGGSPKSGGIWNNDNRLLNFLDLDLLSRVVDQIRFLNSTFQQNVACLGSEIEAIERELTSLKIKLSNTHNNSHFEWVDGGFLRAVERGDWILLENANLCSPTVLDRLNPLLEPEGSILVNERGLSNDTATVLHAHPNFRLFLTMDPHNGEVSRAMRNRGVEIHLMQPHTWIDNPIVFSGEEKRTKPGKDSQKYLIQAGIPFFSLTTSMKDAHMNFRELLDPSANDYSDGLQKLCQWLRLFWQLFYRGYTLSRSLRCSWDQIYGQESEDVGMREKIANVYSTHLGCLSFASEHLSTLQVPGGWPRPMNISYFCRMSIEAITTRDCMYLKHLLCEWFAHHLYSAWSSADENERKDLLQWLQNQKNLAVMLPTQLYMILLYPSFEDNTVFPDEEKHDTKMLDNMIVYASFWIMRQARSTALRAIQIAWMRFQATKLELHCYSFTLVYKIIQKESEHPLVKELLSDSVHIGANENFYVNVLDALRHMLLQWEMEDDFFNKSSAGLKKSERKSFLLSRKHSKYSGEEAELKDEGFQIYAALLHTRDLEKELLCGQLLQNMKTLKSFLNILDCHKVFWKAFCKTKAGSADIYIKSQGLYLCWKKLKRNIIEAISGIETEELERRLMQIVENIEKKILKKKQIMRLYIWKGCGHPHMPSSDHSFQKLQELLNFCQSFWPYSAHEIVSSTTSADCNTFPISRSGKFRNLVMEGISMGIYAIRSSCKEKNHVSMSIGQELRNAGGVTDEIIKCLQNYVDGQNMQSIFEIGRLRVPGCKCAPLHSIQDSYYYEAILHEAADSSRLVIGPWLDSLALLQDIVVVSIITQMTKMLMCSDNADISVKECHIKDRMLEVIDFALKFSSRSPLDLVPHQHILWLMNAIEENEHLDARWIKEFQMSAHQLRFNWYTAVFGRSQGSNMVQGQASGSSPAALFDASHSVRISHLISDIVPLGQLNIKILELRLAASILWHFKDCEVINSMASDVSHASAALCQLICSFAKSFESENSAQLHLLTTVLHSGVVQECRSNIMNNIEQLKLLLRKSSDGNLVMLLDSHINICLDLLYSEFCCNSPKQDIHFDKSFQSILGRVWLLLGHVRIKLLLPNEAYDPALKYAFKLCALQEALAEAKLELQVYEESDMIIKGGSTTGKYEGLRDRIQGLKDEIEYIASKCVYRPRAENLIFFYSEVNRFVRSLEQFNNIFTTNRLLEMDTEKQSLHQMIQELLQWQDISNGFIKRIQIDFPDFQDLAQPVLLSVYEMKMGCAMLFEAFQQKLLATTTCSTLTASNALEFVCSLMEFPRSYKAIVNALRSLKDEEREPLIPIFEEDFVESMICLLAIKDQNEVFFQFHMRLRELHVVE
ncbi:hypothetical protein KP509_1Z301100 [Ceratopteris richardii]|nr:hypothetical protein KP509_1Z301100 [Ceratopteris richardii]